MTSSLLPDPVDTLVPEPYLRKPTSLSRLATIFAITFGIAFGLCTTSATIGMSANSNVARFFIWASIVIEAICLIGLIVIALISIYKAVARRFFPADEKEAQ
jgi:hypothetical protein